MFDVLVLTIVPAFRKNELDILLSLVPQEKQEKIHRFRFFRDAQNTLLGDVLVRNEICRATGLANRELVFSTNAYGKPFLQNDPHIHFNISHTGSYVTCAVSDEPVGIDIELIKPIDLKIAERFFAPDETAYIMGNPHPLRFFEVWTKKESRIKWEGKGLSRPLPSFSVFDPTELEKLKYYNVFQNDEVICHVCSAAGEKPVVRVMDTTALMRYLI